MKFAVAALIATVAAEADGDAAKEVKAEGAECTMGEDQCGYEEKKTNICMEWDYSGLDSAKTADLEEYDAATMTGKKAVCSQATNCKADDPNTKAYTDAGASYTCSAKALAASMATVAAALATM